MQDNIKDVLVVYMEEKKKLLSWLKDEKVFPPTLTLLEL